MNDSPLSFQKGYSDIRKAHLLYITTLVLFFVAFIFMIFFTLYIVRLEVVGINTNVHEALVFRVNSTSWSSNKGSVANAVGTDASFQCTDLQVISLPPTLLVSEEFKFLFDCFCSVYTGFERGHSAICRGTTLYDMVIIVFGIMWNHHSSVSGVLIASKSKVELN